jgi:hypothetical protein
MGFLGLLEYQKMKLKKKKFLPPAAGEKEGRWEAGKMGRWGKERRWEAEKIGSWEKEVRGS